MRSSAAFVVGGILLLTAACGGSQESSSEEEGKAKAGIRRICLERREDLGLLTGVWARTCPPVGVTDNSPPPDSPEAEAAARKAEESSKRIEEEIAEEPQNQMQKRAVALLDLTRGNRAAAERELEEGCPKADPQELSEAWWELRKLANPEEGSVAELEEALEELCPL